MRNRRRALSSEVRRNGRPVAIDVFCGAGGMSLGLQRAGIEVLLGIDTDPVAAETYRTNLSVPVLEQDIRSVTATHLGPFVPNGSELVLAVCAPCQAFSKVRRGKRRRDDRQLLLSVARLVRSLRPAGIIVENVPPIASGRRASILNAFCRVLRETGYAYVYGNLDAKDFGVPQTRRRMVLLAVKGHRPVTLPEQGRFRPRTVLEAIGDLPGIEAGERASGYPLHKAWGLSELNLERIRATPFDGGDSRSWNAKLRLACHRKTTGFYDVYGRMRWDTAAPTLTTRCNSLSNGRFGHPEQDRAISLLEAAILQTFPRRYRFAGNQHEIARQIGNAVPVQLAKVLGRTLLRQL